MTETKPEGAFPLLNDRHLRMLYGAIIRKYVELGLGTKASINAPQFGLGRRMRDEITRRQGERWLTRYYQ